MSHENVLSMMMAGELVTDLQVKRTLMVKNSYYRHYKLLYKSIHYKPAPIELLA